MSAAEETEKTPTQNEEEEKAEADKKAPNVDKAALREQFEAFAKFGDKSADGKTIKLSQSDKWFKQAKVIDPKKITTTDTGIAFRKISKNSPKLSFADWNKYLDEIAKNKSIDANEIKGQLVNCGKPGFSRTTVKVYKKSIEIVEKYTSFFPGRCKNSRTRKVDRHFKIWRYSQKSIHCRWKRPRKRRKS